MRQCRNLVLATAVAAFFSAGVQAAGVEPGSDVTSSQLSRAEIEILSAQKSRRDFERRQQLLRALDRMMAGAPQPRLNVPIMRPGRQVRPFGNSYIK